MSVRVVDLEPLVLAGDCDACGSIRIMATEDPAVYFCDECWSTGAIEGSDR